MLLIQYLRHSWTKKERNIEGARERANLPTELSFHTPTLPPSGECWIQHRGRIERADWIDRVVVGPLEIIKTGDTVSTNLYTGQWSSTPNDLDSPKPITLSLNETVQYFLQFRNQFWDDAWFERQVVNVAWLSRFDPEIFRLRPFTHQVRYRSPVAI
ncbi:MAG TPA: hypothetical protein EYO33_07885 [Phycisphaerales bacterium]|nr:hypothetical protein [Phycisphaerales bacterium]